MPGIWTVALNPQRYYKSIIFLKAAAVTVMVNSLVWPDRDDRGGGGDLTAGD